VDPKTATALNRLRLVSAPEAVSFLLLLVCSVLKRTTDFNAVPVMGSVHGVLFIGYVLLCADAWKRAGFSRGTGVLYLVLAVLPAGGFLAERRLRREPAGAAAGARTEEEVAGA
jgi:integral membrane protein